MCRILFVETRSTREWACDLFRLAIPDVQIQERNHSRMLKQRLGLCGRRRGL